MTKADALIVLREKVELTCQLLEPYASEPLLETMKKTLLTICNGGSVDILARVDGREYRWEADWLKYLPLALTYHANAARPDLPEGVGGLKQWLLGLAQHYEDQYNFDQRNVARRAADALEALAAENAEYRRIIFGGAESLPETSTDLQKQIAKHHQEREAEIAAKDAEIARLKGGLATIHASLRERQKRLGEEFEAAIFDDLESLYED